MTTHVKFCTAQQIGASSIEGPARVAQTLEETATSQATTISAQQDEIAVITSTANIHARIQSPGTSAPAGPNVGEMLAAGSRLQLRCNLGDVITIRTI